MADVQGSASSRGSTVFITGAAGHLGRAVAELFAERGANLVLAGRRESLERAFGAPDPARMFAVGDLSKHEEVASIVAAALAQFGRIDVLCNIAGGFRMGKPVHASSDDDWEAMIDINLRTLLNTVRAVVPAMLEAGGGRIVNVGAAAALKAPAGMAAYAASKAAVVRVTEAMSAELRHRNINVNCVLPTTLDTPDNRQAMPNGDPARWVAPRDLAAVIAFLASEDARAIHGAAIPVTGLG